MKTDEAFGLLGLPSSASPDDIRAARKRLAPLYHPDTGGSNAAFGDLEAATKIALIWAATAPCPMCDGIGNLIQASGFSIVRLPCHRCGGTKLRWN